MKDIYQICFYGGLILAILLFITAVVLFFVLKIPHVVGDLTGSNARKTIKEMSTGTSKTVKDSASKKEQAKYYNVGTGKITVKEAVSDTKEEQPSEEVTEVLGAGRLADPEEQTEVLGAGRFAVDDEATEVLADDSEATEVLSSNADDFDGDAATDVLTSDDFDGDAATDVLTSDDFDGDAATDVLTEDMASFVEKPSEEETTVLNNTGITNPKITVLTNIVVVHSQERI